MHHLPHRTLLHGLAFAAVLFSTLTLSAPRAHAYTWMVRHGYTGCAMCHADPAGGALLTPYGRAQGELLLRTRYGASESEEDVALGDFAFGAFKTPDSLLLGGDIRGASLTTSINNGAATSDFILMQLDLQAQWSIGPLRINGSLGYAHQGAYAATLVGDDGNENALVSRTHWLGLVAGEDENIMLRAGKMNLPYGLRIIEHTAWIKSATRSDTNSAQQDGVSLSYIGENWRGEVMGFFGNLQISPSNYWESGYAATAEYSVSETFAIGGSSLIAHTELDPQYGGKLWRHAHGAFARYAPKPWLVVLAEADFTLFSQPTHNAYGIAAFLQLDFEPVQGLHFIATGESQNSDFESLDASFGAWASIAWFFAPHADIRFDGIYQSYATPQGVVPAQSFLAQLHMFL